MGKKSYLLVVTAALFLLATGCPNSTPESGGSKPKQTDVDKGASVSTADESLTDVQKRILGITQSEQLLQSLSTKFKQLARSFREPGIDSSSFAASAIVYDHGLEDVSLSSLISQDAGDWSDFATKAAWPLSDDVSDVQLGQIWSPLRSLAPFEDAQVGTTKAYFQNDYQEFVTETKFEGRFQHDQRIVGIKGKQIITWKEDGRDNWKIAGWKQKELNVISSPESLFENVTSQLIPDADLLAQVSRSPHQEIIVDRSRAFNVDMTIKHADDEFKAFSDWQSTGQYPTVSVVDYDLDGLDDIFLTDRWESPHLLRNTGEGTFVDVTKEAGLSFQSFVTCGYFFDFDNDGDSDFLVGYSVRPSRFYVNEGGKFVPHEAINKVLEEVRVVVSVAAADVNRDGLLDLYLCTYPAPEGPTTSWIKDITRPSERVKTRLKIERSDRFVDRGGPPNILLMNRGDTFEWPEISDDLKQYRGSYQASWMDFDNDGDQDLYVCNDFSPDVFLRNDTERGSFRPVFVDVTSEIAPTVQMGFGMGTSYGDYDNDGDLDLYVCNMYSKAGNRIIAQLEDVDERLAVSARGNFLYENENGEFKQVAGESNDQQHINVVGWSFGGQFADFDNDGQLDLFVPSGYYSAPPEVKTDVDL